MDPKKTHTEEDSISAIKKISYLNFLWKGIHPPHLIPTSKHPRHSQLVTNLTVNKISFIPMKPPNLHLK